jgi:hypothetical protein
MRKSRFPVFATVANAVRRLTERLTVRPFLLPAATPAAGSRRNEGERSC